MNDEIGDRTAIRYVESKTKEGEVDETVKAIEDYVHSGKYMVCKDGVKRPLGYGDIAVICRNTAGCRMVRDACEAAGIPAYLQGEVEIMSTREGKLALAWLRYVNNDRDPWAFVPIMADMDYTPIQIREASLDPAKVPAIIKQQREDLYRKRRRITDLLTCLFQFYSLDNDITQAIISTMSAVHRGSLLTISDVIRIIEDDIANGATYPVENFIDTKAVSIMTMHKSKGLEFAAVITPFIDQNLMPSTKGEASTFFFNERLGLRCTSEIGSFGDYAKVCTNWRTSLARSAVKKDYSEERRLLFVALSRAQQYETIICGPSPSKFMKDLSGGNFETIPLVEKGRMSVKEKNLDVPKIPDYPVRRVKMAVHDILDFSDGSGSSVPEGADEVSGKGMEYGTQIHKIAELMQMGRKVDESYPEVPEIRKVLDRTADADLRYAEIECGLPIEDTNITLRGVIDLLAIYPDHMEVHDYKTDVSDRFESEYIIQLSVYAYAVQAFYGKRVECYIDYVSRGVTKQVEIADFQEIRARALTQPH